MIDLSRWQHQTNCFKSITHDATYYYHKMHGLCILFKYRYHIRTIIIINWRFHARLALGSCGSQDLWGLSEWPASINEHGAINRPQSRGGGLGGFGLIKQIQVRIQPLLLTTS